MYSTLDTNAAVLPLLATAEARSAGYSQAVFPEVFGDYVAVPATVAGVGFSGLWVREVALSGQETFCFILFCFIPGCFV